MFAPTEPGFIPSDLDMVPSDFTLAPTLHITGNTDAPQLQVNTGALQLHVTGNTDATQHAHDRSSIPSATIPKPTFNGMSL